MATLQSESSEQISCPSAADIQGAEQELQHIWKNTEELLQTLQNPADTVDLLRRKLAATQCALQAYTDAWEELKRLYSTSLSYNDRAMQTKTTFLENSNHVNIIIAETTERACSLALETASSISRHSRASSRSRKSSQTSKASSSHLSLKALALASAAAAAKNVVFEEAIAKRTTEMVSQQAARELEHARHDAENKLLQTQYDLEQRTSMATAEADLNILRARQAAATEKARSDALTQAELNENEDYTPTTPAQTSNDHASQFCAKMAAAASSPTFVPNVPPANLTKQITDTLARQRQPAHEPDVYRGDPIMFQPWRCAFETMIDQAETPATQKLAFLAKYTAGDVKQLVDCFRHRHVLNPQTAYDEAWQELEERFGNKTKIASQIMQKLTTFPKIRAEERHKLLEFADSCVDIAAQMKDLPGLNVLNYPYNLHPVLEKLPIYLHNKWREQVSKYKKTHDTYPPFQELAKFLKEKARTSNDPDLYPPATVTSKAYKEASNPSLPPHKSPHRVMATNSPLSAHQTTPITSKCVFHDRTGHDLAECIVFGRKPMTDRREFCKQKGLCFKCGQNHRVKDCQTKVKCKKCESTSHASFMHAPTIPNGGEPEVEKTKENLRDTPEANTKCTRYTTCVMARSCSKIVLVKVYHRNKPSVSIEAYAVLDDQSNTCLADPKLFDVLNINGPSYQYELSTCGGRGILTNGRRVHGLVIESMSGHKEYLPTVLENENIPGDRDEIPSPDMCKMFPHLNEISDKIPRPRDDINITLLIGRSCPEPLKIRESRNGPKGTPWAQRTDMGWTVSGRMCTSSIKGREHVSANHTIVTETSSLLPSPDTYEVQPDYYRTCENHINAKDVLSAHQNKRSSIYAETQDDDQKAPSVEDRRFIKIMTENVHTNHKGNLEFPLPFKDSQTRLPNNRSQVQIRLNNLLKTLRRKPDLMKEYQAFLGKILDKEHATPVPDNELTAPSGTVWYLPHFPVRNPKKPGIRVVFDSSSEFSGVSLNKVLLQGPDQMNTLLGILLRFRVGEVAVMGDVEQMFHNFHVNPEHRNFLRFLWFQNNDPEKPIIDYRMNVHLFGNVSSPAIATFGIRMIAEEGRSTHGADVPEFVRRDFYVDDGLTSHPNPETAISLIKRTRDALASKNLRFHKIISNSKEVMNALPQEARAKDVKSLDFDHDRLPIQRSLGVHWSLEKDAFTLIVNLPNKPFSRRGVLSIASSIFDPLGFVTPVTIEGKLILRELMVEMKKETNVPKDIWDRPLPETRLPRWNRWRDSLYDLQNIYIERCYKPPQFGEVRRRELHVFCDASQLATGAVSYLRLLNEHGQPHVSLLLAKAKVAPTHAVSIPRLELCAAVLATTLSQTLETELRDRVLIDKTTFYSDSKVVLGYIANESRRFHVYVANRVHKIHTASEPNQWRHVPTDQNPADLASRSVPARELNNTTWFRGPDFLWQTDPPTSEATSSESIEQTLDESDPEVRKLVATSATTVGEETRNQSKRDTEASLSCSRFSRFSSWKSLKQAIGLLVRKVQTFKASRNGTTDEASKTLSVLQLQQAEKAILKAVQSQYFKEEVQILRKAQTNPTLAISKKSTLLKLSPFLDEDGVLRVGGRLKRSDLDFGTRHPIVLPKDSHVSKLLVEHFHQQVQHQGRQLTLGAVRSAGLWITGSHNLIRSIINRCVTCKKLRGKPLNQIMADLPADRVSATPPFTNVGMDVFGPWTVVTRKTRGGSSDSKRWAVIFTCLYSRAIHLEVIESMDTSAFISAFRRFVAIRGPVTILRCDQGTNFIGAKNELAAALDEMDKEQVASYLSSNQCQWVFNPPHASHFGGVWERLIGIVRRVLDAMFTQLGKHQLTHEVLVTFMAEASAIVNSRPLCTIPSDADDPQAISPSMLLTSKSKQLQPPPGRFVKQDEYSRKRWRRVQYLADQFWLRWKRDYLQSLQPRQKWPAVKPDIGEGDVVLLRDKELPRLQWPLARVTKVHLSEDGLARKVEVAMYSEGTRRTYSRPISELILIEKAPKNS